MRITTQMLNESARKAGLPINNTSFTKRKSFDNKEKLDIIKVKIYISKM